MGYPVEIAEVSAKDILDAHAHDLAEMLRDNIGRADYEHESERTKQFVFGWRSAASVLDPEYTGE